MVSSDAAAQQNGTPDHSRGGRRITAEVDAGLQQKWTPDYSRSGSRTTAFTAGPGAAIDMTGGKMTLKGGGEKQKIVYGTGCL